VKLARPIALAAVGRRFDPDLVAVVGSASGTAQTSCLARSPQPSSIRLSRQARGSPVRVSRGTKLRRTFHGSSEILLSELSPVDRKNR
jgi:hypothetical protein